MSNIDVHNLSEKDQHLSEPPAMTDERLQEIKDVLKNWTHHPNSYRFLNPSEIDELITALEAAQAELAEAKHEEEIYIRNSQIYIKENANLRAQLDDANSQLRTNNYTMRQIPDLRKQLAKAQEAVEKFRYEMPELRPEEM